MASRVRLKCIAISCALFATQHCQVVYRTYQSCQSFVILCARFPTLRSSIACRADFICRKALQVFGLAIENTEMRPKELIGRTNQEVGSERLHIDWTMRCKLYGINPHQRANFVC